MQQRRVRLGDLLDDYCPRERRITNHAVVAMIDDEVKQTRCTTCEAEHVYKGAKVPAPRRKKAGAVSTAVPESLAPRPLAAGAHARDDEDDIASAEEITPPETVDSPEIPVAASAEALPAEKEEPPPADAGDEEPAAQDDWVHRRLIRATLPRQEGQTPERKAPDFTLRQQGGRFDNNRNGQRSHGGPRPGRPGQPPRFGSGSGQSPRHGSGQPPRHGSGQGSGQGQRQGNRPGQARPGG